MSTNNKWIHFKNKIPKLFGENNIGLNNEIKNKIYNLYLNKYTINLSQKKTKIKLQKKVQ